MVGNKSIVVGAFALASAVSAQGDFIVVNNPVYDYAAFGYSDAYSTGAQAEYPQSVAQSFALGEDHLLTSLRWWGGMNNFFQTGDTNLAGFEIIVWNEDFSQQVVNQTVKVGEISSTFTGFVNQFGGRVNEFFMPFSHFLTEGNYHMNIGATYYTFNAPESPWGFGADQWLWTSSLASIEDPLSTYITMDNPPNGPYWGTWFNDLLGTGVGTGINSGAFVLTAPTPGAIALIALGGLVGGRRRR